ncbi:MAG: hypothetical protein ACXVIE_08640 [Halobacteriota archaeon]
MQKRLTSRIIVQEDVQNVLTHIRLAEQDGRLDKIRAEQYRAFVLFGASTGQRSVSDGDAECRAVQTSHRIRSSGFAR